MDAYDWTWKQQLLDHPRRERWAAFDMAAAEGLSFDAAVLMDALGLDAEAFAQTFDHLPASQRLAVGKAEAKRRGLPFSASALVEAFNGARW